jgi:hypothetical protein
VSDAAPRRDDRFGAAMPAAGSRGRMRIQSIVKALVVVSLVAVSLVAATPAAAGVWSLGCKGNIGDVTLMFDRYALVVLPKKLAGGDLHGFIRGAIDIFNLKSDGDGFQPKMEFTSGAYEGQGVTLTETASRNISVKHGSVGSRDESTTVMRKTYRLKPVSTTRVPEGDIAMDCLEYMLTAP